MASVPEYASIQGVVTRKRTAEWKVDKRRINKQYKEDQKAYWAALKQWNAEQKAKYPSGLILRVNERIAYEHDTYQMGIFKIGTVTHVEEWEIDSKKGKTYHISVDDGTAEIRSDKKASQYVCRYLDIGEKVIFKNQGHVPRRGKVTEADYWYSERAGFDYLVKFEDDGSEELFVTGVDVHLLHCE